MGTTCSTGCPSRFGMSPMATSSGYGRRHSTSRCGVVDCRNYGMLNWFFAASMFPADFTLSLHYMYMIVAVVPSANEVALTVRRQLLGPHIPLIGPSFAVPPGMPNSWWDAYLSFIGRNESIPDVFTWHSEWFDLSNRYADPQEAAAALTSMLEAHNVPKKPFCINEYGVPALQQPSGVAWFISRLERNNIPGLRGNWAMGDALHDFLANLLGKPTAGTSNYNYTAGGYWPNGEWRVYEYYANSMRGKRVATVGSPDRLFDVYATSDGFPSGVKILCGTMAAEGTWAITVNGLGHLGRAPSGKIGIRTLRFDFNGVYGNESLPVDMGVTEHQYDGDSLTWTVTPATNQTAYAFEFA